MKKLKKPINYKPILGYNNAKTVKGEKVGYRTAILYLAPSNIVKGINVCKFASRGCKEACLYTAGHGRYSNVQQGRIRKTEQFKNDLELFMQCLQYDITKHVEKSKRLGLIPCVRLNGTSDLLWEKCKDSKGRTIFDIFSNVQFYDYTKDHTRLFALTNNIKNYHLTYSRSETRQSELRSLKLLSKGVNVAMVFSTKKSQDLPSSYRGFEVINGDSTDLRFLDKQGSIIGLRAKGKAIYDKSGFVINV